MQLVHFFVVPAVVASVTPPASGAADSPALVYGPDKCVSIKRIGATGTCLLRTDCPTQNIAAFDFSFDCMSAARGRTTHSLGIGSFDTEDEIDTGVQCDACVPPKGGAVVVPASTMPLVSAVARGARRGAARRGAAKAKAAVLHGTSLLQHPHHKKTRKAKGVLLAHHAAAAAASRERPDEERGWSANSQVERYGPGGCVSTWLDEEKGHCMMQTDCDESLSSDLAVYEFGLLCRQDDGDTVRHVFGQNSFDEHETFDTLIECRECLALDEYMDAGSAVKQLADEVSDLTKTMGSVTADLNKLNAAVLEKPAAPAANATPPAANETQFVARQHSAARRSRQQHGKVGAVSSFRASTSHGVRALAKKINVAAAHGGAAKKQQKQFLHHAARQEQEDQESHESQDEDMDSNGTEDEEAVVATMKVATKKVSAKKIAAKKVVIKKAARSQRKSKTAARKASRKQRREVEDADDEADSNEQDEEREQDQDEADAQEDDRGQEEAEDSRDDDDEQDGAQDEEDASWDNERGEEADDRSDDEERSESDA